MKKQLLTVAGKIISTLYDASSFPFCVWEGIIYLDGKLYSLWIKWSDDGDDEFTVTTQSRPVESTIQKVWTVEEIEKALDAHDIDALYER